MSDRTERSILIVLTGSLGDVIRGLPLVDAIKSADKNSMITWLVEDKWSGVLDLHKNIDRKIIFERKRGLAGFISLARQLRRERFDVVLDMQRNFKSGVFNRLAPAARRIGFHPKDSKEGNWIFQHDYIPYRGEAVSKVDHYLLFLEKIGVPIPESPRFGFENIDSNLLAGEFSRVNEGKRVVLVLGSSWPSKDWLPSGYAGLIDLMRAQAHVEIFLAGDKSQTALAQQLMAAKGNERLVDGVGKTTLKQLIGILHQADVVIGPDSGPGHLTAAVGKPYISLFGPTPPLRVAPYGMQRLVLRADIGCSPCWRRECPGLNKMCMRLISAEQVFEKARNFLV